jgi:Cu-processing system ATP-binding protein
MIDFRGVTKKFAATAVLRGVDLTVRQGRVMGLIGPNGAGKTTLIKLLLGLAHPTAGEIRVGGERVGDGESYRARIGYMPQIARFPDNLTARELFDTIRGLRRDVVGVDDEMMQQLALEPHLDKPLRVLSGGTRQKVNACLALLFRPPVLVLDEPTSSLDPLSSALFKDTILARARAGATVLVTSHVMAELEELCDDVALLLDGVIRYVGPVEDLTSYTRQANLERAIASLMGGSFGERRGGDVREVA